MFRRLGPPRVLLALIVALVAVATVRAQAPAPAPGAAILLIVDGPIGPATTDYLTRGLAEAAERDASIVVIRMDTPGGLASSTRDIVRAILASPVPVATYVAPSGARAASAGTYILYASGLAAMAPGTNLGAATPIPMGGTQPLPGRAQEDEEETPADAASAKAVNDAVATMRALAELHGRDAAFAEAAVREAASLTASAALEQNVIELIAPDIATLLAEADGMTVRTADGEETLATADATIVRLEPNWRTRLLAAISNPNIAYILLLIGIYGLIFEFASPGIVFSGVIGAIALLLGLFSLNLIGVDYAGAGLVLLGIALMVAEAFAPSFGILGIGGAAAFALGSVFMFEDVPGFELSLSVVLVATAFTLLLLVIALAAVVRSRRARTVSGDQALVGATGRVVSWSGNEGDVQVHGERWRARGAATFSPGDRVEVTGRDELVLIVRRATQS